MRFSSAKLRIPVYLDLNLGMNRTGIVPGKEAIRLYRDYQAAADRAGIIAVGLHAYDGHIRDADFHARKQKCDESFAAVLGLHTELAEDLPKPVIVAGGSPTFSIHSRRESLECIECSPGTFIYWDKGYQDLCPEQSFKPAALVITRIVSLPDSSKLCLDLGHKSIAAENDLGSRVHFLNSPGAAASLTPVAQSEEHLVVDAGPGHGYQIGDILFGLPMHICPTVALYERAFIVENGLFTGEWKNQARDRKLSV